MEAEERSSTSVYYTKHKPKNKKREAWCSSASMYYTKRKPKNKKKNGGGLGTRLSLNIKLNNAAPHSSFFPRRVWY